LVSLAFQRIDKDGSGIVDFDDIKDTYNASSHPEVLSGKRSAKEVLIEFLEVFEVGEQVDGKVTLEEFENYYANISASIDNDDYFELMIRNAWHISGGEGWAANSANRRVLVTRADGTQAVAEIEDDLGLAADDKEGMVARLRKQGMEAADVSTTYGSEKMKVKSLASRPKSATSCRRGRLGATATAAQCESSQHDFSTGNSREDAVTRLRDQNKVLPGRESESHSTQARPPSSSSARRGRLGNMATASSSVAAPPPAMSSPYVAAGSGFRVARSSDRRNSASSQDLSVQPETVDGENGIFIGMTLPGGYGGANSNKPFIALI
jgi:hypothetical protein